MTKAVAQRKERTENGSYLGSLPLPVPPCSSAESVLLFTTPASESGGDKQGGKKGEARGECVCVCAYERESRAGWVDTARPQLSKDSAPPSFFFLSSVVLDFPNRWCWFLLSHSPPAPLCHQSRLSAALPHRASPPQRGRSGNSDITANF